MLNQRMLVKKFRGEQIVGREKTDEYTNAWLLVLRPSVAEATRGLFRTKNKYWHYKAEIDYSPGVKLTTRDSKSSRDIFEPPTYKCMHIKER